MPKDTFPKIKHAILRIWEKQPIYKWELTIKETEREKKQTLLLLYLKYFLIATGDSDTPGSHVVAEKQSEETTWLYGTVSSIFMDFLSFSSYVMILFCHVYSSPLVDQCMQILFYMKLAGKTESNDDRVHSVCMESSVCLNGEILDVVNGQRPQHPQFPQQ